MQVISENQIHNLDEPSRCDIIKIEDNGCEIEVISEKYEQEFVAFYIKCVGGYMAIRPNELRLMITALKLLDRKRVESVPPSQRKTDRDSGDGFLLGMTVGAMLGSAG